MPDDLPTPARPADPPTDPHTAVLSTNPGFAGWVAPVAALDPDGPPGYELGEVVGRGGMGVVHRARDARIGREVAVKLLRDNYPAGGRAARLFLAEARITGQLQHPGIPPVHEVGELADGRPFLAMKLIKGQTLAELLKANAERGRLVAVFEGVCQAVGYAHAHGVIHRDLKPQNVMVGAFGEVQVMDWGLAKVLSAASREGEPSAAATTPGTVIAADRAESDHTQDGQALGTPAYMPPEQAVGAVADMDRRSDVFGLGAVLCHLLTGKPPYADTDLGGLRQLAAQARLADAFTRLDGCGAEPELVALCKRCLTADRAERPSDAGEVAAAVAALRQAADDRARAAEVDRGRAEVRRRLTVRAAAAVAAVLLFGLAGTAVGLVQADWARERESLQRAAAETATAREAAERQRAEAQAALATAVKGFLQQDVLMLADPSTQAADDRLKLDGDLRLRDVLVRAAEAINGRFPDRPLVEADLRWTIGCALLGIGRADLAAGQFDRQRVLLVRHCGPDHTETLWCLHNLAVSYAALGRRADALQLLEECLAARRRLLPPDHPVTLTTLNSLANSYNALGRHDDALRLREECLVARRRVLPPDHADTLTSLHNLADSYNTLGRQADALRLREECLAAQRRVLPLDHPDTLTSVYSVANSYAAAGRRADALTLREECLAARRRVIGREHPDTLTTLDSLADSYDGVGRRADALRLREECLAGRRRAYPPDHPETLASLTNLAASYSALGRRADALPLLEESFAKKLRVLPADHHWLYVAANYLTGCYTALGRGADATATADRYLRHVRGQKSVDSGWVAGLLTARNRHPAATGDAAGCRATAELAEQFQPTAARQLYDAACFWAIAAWLHGKANQPTETTAAADRAMGWLTKAVAAGFRDRSQMLTDDDLALLRGRADFRKLLASLPEPAPLPRPAGSGVGASGGR